MLTDSKIIRKLTSIEKAYEELIFKPVQTLNASHVNTHREHHRQCPSGPRFKWKKAEKGLKWGKAWESIWFKSEAVLPENLIGKRVFISAVTNAVECMLEVDGELKGLFNSSQEVGARGNHHHCLMTLKGQKGKKYNLAFEAYAGHPCAGTHPRDPRDKGLDDASFYQHTYEGIFLCEKRDDVADFVFDLKVLNELVESLDKESFRANKVALGLAGVYELVYQEPLDHPEESWRPLLKKARKLMAPLLKDKNGDSAPQAGIIGHSHMDTAWLWTMEETIRKCARTYSEALNLMDQYPEYMFLQSAPYHSQWMKDHYPGLYAKIKKRIAEGRWEPNGGMWVEPDCNMPSGESLIRQFLEGYKFTKSEYNYQANAYWQPDVFGYSANLPQIMQGCGVDYFLTTKLSWNQTNRFPVDTFHWKGIDGSTVIAHFNTTHTYPSPKHLIQETNDIIHKDIQDRRLCTFGLGDGGGGPEYEMLETARRVGDLEGCPKATFTTLAGFMNTLKEELGPGLPIYEGELYLEAHRGTLTSIHRIKRGNRKFEFALRNLDYISALCGTRKIAVPAEKIEQLWKVLLRNQFHDVLPGTSLPEVHDTAIKELEAGIEDTVQLTGELAAKVMPKGAESNQWEVVNTHGWLVNDLVRIPGLKKEMQCADEGQRSQWIEDLQGNTSLYVHLPALPALGRETVQLKSGSDLSPSPFIFKGRTLDTPFAKIKFDKQGAIASFVDKVASRELVVDTPLNSILLGEDIPELWDNWDIDYDQKFKLKKENGLIESAVVADGPLQFRLRQKYELGQASIFSQDIIFYAHTPRVDFETVVDWREKHALLKAEFKLNVKVDSARHEIQFGHVARPTHDNLSQDRVQFEVCNHKWTDLSETRYGVTVLNDSKYGISVKDETLRLSLLKGGRHPDPRGDEGVHEFTYSLVPHASGFNAADVIRPAYQLNSPPLLFKGAEPKRKEEPLVSLDKEHVVCNHIKWAEKDKAYVLRLYEAEKTACSLTLQFPGFVKRVEEVNMLEENGSALKLVDGKVALAVKPFEIKTIKAYL
ncbi:MAG: alpha-mannosidase [Candidatus Latescibacterota bacterium]|jgi:alpha-mannosidase